MYLSSNNQHADIFTKALGKQQFEFLWGKLSIADLHALTWGRVLEIDTYNKFIVFISGVVSVGVGTSIMNK